MHARLSLIDPEHASLSSSVCQAQHRDRERETARDRSPFCFPYICSEKLRGIEISHKFIFGKHCPKIYGDNKIKSYIEYFQKQIQKSSPKVDLYPPMETGGEKIPTC